MPKASAPFPPGEDPRKTIIILERLHLSSGLGAFRGLEAMSLGLGDYLVTMEKSELKGQLRKQILTDLLTDLFILSQCQVNAKADSA